MKQSIQYLRQRICEYPYAGDFTGWPLRSSQQLASVSCRIIFISSQWPWKY